MTCTTASSPSDGNTCAMYPRKARLGPSDHHLGARQLGMVVQEVCGPVQTDRGLPGARAALHGEHALEWRPDHLVLLHLDGGDDVEHLSGARPFQLGEERVAAAQPDLAEVDGAVVEHIVGIGDAVDGPRPSDGAAAPAPSDRPGGRGRRAPPLSSATRPPRGRRRRPRRGDDRCTNDRRPRHRRRRRPRRSGRTRAAGPTRPGSRCAGAARPRGRGRRTLPLPACARRSPRARSRIAANDACAWSSAACSRASSSATSTYTNRRQSGATIRPL